MMMIIIIWIVYRFNKFIAGIQISKSNNRKKTHKTRHSGLDILDAEYEEME